jgi:hypothetical protein
MHHAPGPAEADFTALARQEASCALCGRGGVAGRGGGRCGYYSEILAGTSVTYYDRLLDLGIPLVVVATARSSVRYSIIDHIPIISTVGNYLSPSKVAARIHTTMMLPIPMNWLYGCESCTC